LSDLREPRQGYEGTGLQPKLFTTDSDEQLRTLKRARRRTPQRVAQPLASAVDTIAWVTDGKFSRKHLKLFPDVGQVYELLLARMEFLGLGRDLSLLRQRAAYFEEVAGEKTDHFFLSAVRGKGQIGHSNQYLTHWFYPYKGKYHGQMIKALINFMGIGPDGLVLDPFVGSGTALIEYATLVIPSVGIDINPALCMVSQIKVDSLSIQYPDLQRALAELRALGIFAYFSRRPTTLGKWSLGFHELNRDTKELLGQAWARASRGLGWRIILKQEDTMVKFSAYTYKS
jgi:hypothetical protein